MSRPLGDQLGLRSLAGLSFRQVHRLSASELRNPDVVVNKREEPGLVRLIGQTLAVGRPGGVALDIQRRGHLNRVSQLRHAGRAWPAAIGQQPEANGCDPQRGDGRNRRTEPRDRAPCRRHWTGSRERVARIDILLRFLEAVSEVDRRLESIEGVLQRGSDPPAARACAEPLAAARSRVAACPAGSPR